MGPKRIVASVFIPLFVMLSWIVSTQESTDLSQQEKADLVNGAEKHYQEARALIKEKHRLSYLKFSEAVRLWQQAHEMPRVVEVLLEMGGRYAEADNWQYALWCYQQLLPIETLSDPVRLVAFNAIARLYADLSQLDLASSHYEKALKLAEKLHDSSARIKALIGLAAVYIERGELEQAIARLEPVQRVQPQEKGAMVEATVIQLLGRIYQKQNRAVEAREAFEKSLMLSRQADDQDGIIKSLCLLSGVDLALGRERIALEQAEQAVQQARKCQDREAEWQALLRLGRVQRALGQAEDAGRSYFRAMSLIEMKRLGHLTADAFKITFLDDRQAVYRELVDLLIETNQRDESFLVVEHARARATLDLLARARSKEGGFGTPEHEMKRREIKQRLDQIRTELRSPELADWRRIALEAERKDLEQRHEELRQEIEMNYRSRFVRPVTLKQVQEEVLGPNDVLLEFFLGEPRSFVWHITPADANLAILPGRKAIEEKTKDYLAVVSTPLPNRRVNQELGRQKEFARQLFQVLLGPFAARLKPGQRLIVAPDGWLSYLPFETLVRDGRYLIEDHEIISVPSASVLRLLKSPGGKPRPEASKELLALGDPVFGALPKEDSPSALSPDQLMWKMWAASGYQLAPLPNTRGEVLSIGGFFQPGQQDIHLGTAATEEVIKGERPGHYRLIHFATHSLIDDQVPGRSGIVLALDEDPAEDGFLEVHEIADLDLNCDLVVLSACQTGRGKLVMGEGIVGLTRAFLYAGARSVAVSLWNVSDLSTARFMEGFYRPIAEKRGIAAALRAAKLEMLRSDQPLRHPYYWAPFVLVGYPD